MRLQDLVFAYKIFYDAISPSLSLALLLFFSLSLLLCLYKIFACS